MARTSKAKNATEVVDTPVVEQTASTTTPVVEKAVKVKKPRAPKTETATTETTSATQEVAPVTTGTEDVPVDAVDIEASVAAQSVEFLAKLNQLSVIVSSLKNEYRTLEKKWARELKVAQKANSKRKRKTGNRAPSGFVKPTRISDELAKFLEKPTGTEMARTDVTREINKYIRSHNLQDSQNGRKINPDSKLSSLLKLKKTDELTYFNLQRFMSPHFSKAVKEAVVA
jgi:chromatin remodeling complex protein RSC6